MTDKRSVLFVHTPTLSPLGADVWVHGQIIGALDRDQHVVHVACIPGPPSKRTPTFRLISSIPDVRIVATNLGPELTYQSRWGRLAALVSTVPAPVHFVRLARYIKRHGISVIHTSDRPRDALATVLLGRITGARSIVHAHVAYNPDWMGRPLRWSIRHADALIAISEFVAESLTEAGRDPSTVHVALNAIDTSLWVPGAGRETARRELGIDADAPVVITVCRLFPAKGPADLVRAIAAVRDTLPDVRLIVAGQELQPGYLAELKSLVAELGLAGAVTFTGRRSDVAALMAASDVFAMPSFLEPFGLVYLEAMAMERPVVALSNGGTPEVVDHGGSGLLSAPGDHAALVANLVTLLCDPQRRAEMGRHGRERALTFTVERLAADVASAYRLVTSTPSDAEV